MTSTLWSIIDGNLGQIINKADKKEAPDLKEPLRLYLNPTATHLFLKPNNKEVWLLDDSRGCFVEWTDPLDEKTEYLGEITQVDACGVTFDDGSGQDLHPEIVWQIETMLQGPYLVLKSRHGIYIGRSIGRDKYANDKKVAAAEEAHVQRNFGYSKLTIVKKKNDHWEDEVNVARRTSSRR
jgi:hypothetical protein